MFSTIANFDNCKITLSSTSLLLNKIFPKAKIFEIYSEKVLIKNLCSTSVQALVINYSNCSHCIIKEIKTLRSIFEDLKIIIYNFSHSEYELKQLIHAGSNAIFDQSFDPSLIGANFEFIHINNFFFNDLVTEKYYRRIKSQKIIDCTELKEMEISIIRNKCSGMSNEEMAIKFHFSLSHIKNTLHAIYEKTGTVGIHDLMLYACNNKLVQFQLDNEKINNKLNVFVGL